MKDRDDIKRIMRIRGAMYLGAVLFGIAPVAAGVAAGMRSPYFIPVFCAYVIAAFVHLARNAAAEECSYYDGSARGHTLGLSPFYFLFIFPPFYLVAKLFSDELIRNILLAVCFVSCSVLYVLKLKIPKLGIKGLIILTVIKAVAVAAYIIIRYSVIQ